LFERGWLTHELHPERVTKDWLDARFSNAPFRWPADRTAAPQLAGNFVLVATDLEDEIRGAAHKRSGLVACDLSGFIVYPGDRHPRLSIRCEAAQASSISD
jgi:hypothetical protein